jgi:hypothetical protein
MISANAGQYHGSAAEEVANMEQQYYEAAKVLRDALSSKEAELTAEQERRVAAEQQIATLKATHELTQGALKAQVAQLVKRLQTSEHAVDSTELLASQLSTAVTQYQKKLESAEKQIAELEQKLQVSEATAKYAQAQVREQAARVALWEARSQVEVLPLKAQEDEQDSAVQAPRFRQMTVAELSSLPGPPSPIGRSPAGNDSPEEQAGADWWRAAQSDSDRVLEEGTIVKLACAQDGPVRRGDIGEVVREDEEAGQCLIRWTELRIAPGDTYESTVDKEDISIVSKRRKTGATNAEANLPAAIPTPGLLRVPMEVVAAAKSQPPAGLSSNPDHAPSKKSPQQQTPTPTVIHQARKGPPADVRAESLFVRSLKQVVLDRGTVGTDAAAPFDVGKVLLQMRQFSPGWIIGATPFKRFGDFAAAMEAKGHLKLTRGAGGLMVVETNLTHYSKLNDVVAALVALVQRSGPAGNKVLLASQIHKLYKLVPGAKEQIAKAGGIKAVHSWSGGRLDFMNAGGKSTIFIPDDSDSTDTAATEAQRQGQEMTSLLDQFAVAARADTAEKKSTAQSTQQQPAHGASSPLVLAADEVPGDSEILSYIHANFPAWLRFLASKSLKTRDPKLHQASVKREFWRREMTAKPWLRARRPPAAVVPAAVVPAAAATVCVACTQGNCKDVLPQIARLIQDREENGRCTLAEVGTHFRTAHPELMEHLGHQKSGYGSAKVALVIRAHKELFVTERLDHGQERLGLTPLGEQLAAAAARQ